jgi:dTDP-4-amino-4,6-dideoxygalactose transaminase
MKNIIPFNKPFATGKEIEYIANTISLEKISGDGYYTKLCTEFFQNNYHFKKALLTTSCTHALEMASLLINICPDDEVIVPSYTFVSTVNAFVLRGAKIIFIDSYDNHPNLNPSLIEGLITHKTKAIIVVHYGGVACDMDIIMNIAKKYNLFVIEDAAQSIDSFYKNIPLGSIGDFGAFSFHETKNIISGEGGMLTINKEKYFSRAEIIREKGTNRSSFFRGEVNKYEWVDIGSSYLPSEIISAYLYAQLENITLIQSKRKVIWNQYYSDLKILEEKGKVNLPNVFSFATNNAHVFYLVCKNLEERTKFIKYLRDFKISPVFHYLSLHNSSFFSKINGNLSLPNCEKFSDCLVRLPLFYQLTSEEQDYIIEKIFLFYKYN